jgi:excisionase family DNA binding protein
VGGATDRPPSIAFGRAPAEALAAVSPGGLFPTSVLSPFMGDTNISGQSMDAAKIAAAVSAFLDLPRVMRELEVTLRQLRSVVSSAENRPAGGFADTEGGLWDAVQVARFLRVSRSWVYHRAESGVLPCRHVGGLLRFEAEAIREYARTGKVPDPVSAQHQHRGGFGVEPAPTTARTGVEPPTQSSRPALKDPIKAAPTERKVPFQSDADTARRKQLLDVREVAERLRVSTATVYKLCDRGELPHTRVVNVIRVALEDLAVFMAQRGSRNNKGQ